MYTSNDAEQAHSPGNKRPLRILTFNSVGITGLSMLMILDELMNAIAANPSNITKRKPLPCEVFDIIGGIGVGGWIAILLGRLHLDVPTCILAYVEIIHAVEARSRFEKSKLRLHNANFDQTRLIRKVSQIVDRYSRGSGDKMLYQDKEWPRCQFAFAAAAVKGSTDNRKYQIFRTYPMQNLSASPTGITEGRIEGGPDPAECPIAQAFAATAASKYLFNSFSLDRSSTKLFDADSLDPHAITLLAMEEMTRFTSDPPPIQLAFNIESGVSTRRDLRSLAGLPRIFSFGSPLERHGAFLREHIENSKQPESQEKKLEFVEVLDIPQRESPGGPKRRERIPNDKLTRKAICREKKYREDINEALKKYHKRYHSHCPELLPKYIALGPEVAPKNTVLNDVAAANTTYAETHAYICKLRPKMDDNLAISDCTW
ncbi:hypothetical protein ABEF92_004416 [Exophiala dermatitidis]|uniref:PNPLA domain-containing protein n=1 Tax=Exophiala dermatitidis (strain ATCC 34100 / CBS 525.76 / NIH/UT8656) TaxID=858893 RepID=H6BVT8_EXODN|nr:uncharacterized protein HMPREF1120_03246 [Exophiala dermatitidis NIH/UT8656]EHY55092.1 hypothetical protein HMPREF1120_03246 [Exophiala dermatitidis NIH/UT8656]